MSPELATRRLRSLVAELATLDKADTRDILSRLPADQRTKVEGLLASYDESAGAGIAEDEAVDQGHSAANLIFTYVDLSPWLTDRLAGHRDNLQISTHPHRRERHEPASGGVRVSLTPLASDVLRDCAEPFLDNSPLVEWGETPVVQTWIQRLGSGLLGRGHRS